MPNWVDNVMIIKAEPRVLSELRTKIKTDKRDDTEQYFQIARSLYPMPQDLKYVIGSRRDDVKYIKVQDKIVMPPEDWYYKDGKIVSDLFPETNFDVVDLTEGEKKQLEEKHGATNWYDWNIKTYGTKWADVDTQLVSESPTRLVFEFDTAWSPSFSLSGRISDEYKLEVLHKHWSIENMSEGNATFTNGRIVEEFWREIDESELTFESVNLEELEQE